MEPMEPAPPRSIEVSPAEAGQRLDVFLARRLATSRSQVRRLLENGAVSLNGVVQGLGDKGSPTPAAGQLTVTDFRPPDQQRILPEPAAPLQIVSRGSGWLAVDKPAGLPVHPLSEQETGTLLNALVARHPELCGVGEGGLRSGVVHRLDVDTSGVLLVATQQAVWERLRSAFSDHRVEKSYRALVLGAFKGERRVSVGLRVAQHRPARVRVVEAGAAADARDVRQASLRVRPLERLGAVTLVEVQPRTGFLHQIRASLAHIGHPVAGDRTYGPSEDVTGARRHLLHAARVAFEEVEGEAEDAEDFRSHLEQLRSRVSASMSRA